jgi:hypothetical protein
MISINFIKLFNFLWVVFWMFLVVMSPAIFLYLCANGPDFYTQIGHDTITNAKTGEITTLHVPSILSCLLFAVFCIIMVFAPAADWFNNKK